MTSILHVKMMTTTTMTTTPLNCPAATVGTLNNRHAKPSTTTKPRALRVRGARRAALQGIAARRRAPAVVCGSAAEPVSAGANGVVVRLNVHAQLGFGNQLAVVGAADAFGAWAPEKALTLTWTDGDVWAGEVTIPAAAGVGAVEYKLVVVTAEGGFEWEGGENRAVPLDAAAAAAGAGDGGAVFVSGEFGGDVRTSFAAADGTDGGFSVPPPQQQPQHQHFEQAPPPPAPLVSPADRSRQWQGGDINFIRHRDQDAERRAMEEAANRSRGGADLQGASRAIADGDKSSTSWLQKLELIASMVGQGHAISLDKVAACGVYLRWVSTGTIACVEDGHHHRPNRMAEVARDIFINMEMVSGELYKHGPEVGEAERLVMRQIHPWLPSFSSEFTSAVPLTRIRDIAHRNDIPQDVKLEIKHTIQNKLHRNAGPEDLVVTELMLKRITVDAYEGQYNHDFVNEFVIFHQELKRFFNCAGALERVDALRGSMDDDVKGMIDELQAAMWALDGGEAGHDGMLGGEGSAVLRALRAATAVRGHFTGALATVRPDDLISFQTRHTADESVAGREFAP